MAWSSPFMQNHDLSADTYKHYTLKKDTVLSLFEYWGDMKLQHVKKLHFYVKKPFFLF